MSSEIVPLVGCAHEKNWQIFSVNPKQFFSAIDSCFEILVSRIQTVRCLIVARLAPPVIVDLANRATSSRCSTLSKLKAKFYLTWDVRQATKWASQEDDTIRRLFLHPVST